MYGPRGLVPGFTNNPPAGPMIFNQCIRLAQITDGASQTIAVGEDPEAINAMWISGHNIFDQSAPINARPPSRVRRGADQPAPRRRATRCSPTARSTSSRTRPTSSALAALCTRALGDIVSSDSY